MNQRSDPPADPVPGRLVGTRVQMRFIHDGSEMIVTGTLRAAEGGYMVQDGHSLVPVMHAAIVDVRPAGDRDG